MFFLMSIKMCDNYNYIINQPNCSHILLRSVDRDDYFNTSPSNFQVQLSKPVRANRAQISYAHIPNTYYNITNKNNKFLLNTVQQSMPPGCYSLNELIAELSIILNTIGVSNITFNSISNLLTIGLDVNFSIDFNVDNSLANKVGFLKFNYTGANTYTGSYVPKIYENCIYINTNFCTHIQTTSPNKNISFVIPNTVNKGEIIQFYSSTQFNLQPIIANQTIGIIQLQLLDENGDQLINIGDWQIMIQLV
jgi:hypothetical protein